MISFHFRMCLPQFAQWEKVVVKVEDFYQLHYSNYNFEPFKSKTKNKYVLLFRKPYHFSELRLLTLLLKWDVNRCVWPDQNSLQVRGLCLRKCSKSHFFKSENRSLSSFYFHLCQLGSISLGNFFKHKTLFPEECIKCWSICSYFEFYSYTYSMIKYSRLGSTMCCPWHSRDKKPKKVQFFRDFAHCLPIALMAKVNIVWKKC